MKQKIKAVSLCLISILILALAQGIAMAIGSLFTVFGSPAYVEAIVDALLYPILAFMGVKLIVEKLFKYSLAEFRVKKLNIKWYWIVISFLLPIFVIVLFQFVSGSWVVLNVNIISKISIVVWGIFYYSIAAGIVEEMIFRGVIMGTLEKEFNLITAILVPSILFGAAHIIGNSLDFISTIQLIVAGTLVGIMFSLIEYQSGNFWNNTVAHAFWNMSTIGLCHVGLTQSENSLFTYVINTDSTIISGGDFGIESSLFAIIGYSVVCIIALILIKNQKFANTNKKKC